MLKYQEIGLKLILILLCVSSLLYANSRSERMFSVARPAVQKDVAERKVVEEALIHFQAPKDRLPSLNQWIRSASGVTHIDPVLLVCLIRTESRFRKNAVSAKGYKGEAQTKRFSEFSSVNILEGAEILRDKLSLSKGNMFEALARYKGGKDKKEARDQAREILRLYHSELKRWGLWNQ